MRLVKVTAHSFFIGRKIFILFYINCITRMYVLVTNLVYIFVIFFQS